MWLLTKVSDKEQEDLSNPYSVMMFTDVLGPVTNTQPNLPQAVMKIRWLL